jgi:molecular chaperone Hsp33
MLLQKLPNIGGNVVTVDEDAEHWNHLVMLGNTLKTEELLNTDSATLLHRLFWEETVRVFEPQAPSFHCNCSREKVGDMLKMLGQAEVNDAIQELGNIEVSCDFCAHTYRFDAVDCSQLFTAETIVDAVITPSQSKH